MAALIAPMAWNAAASPLAELNTNSEVSGLGLRSVLTPQVADVWRLAGSGTAVTLDVALGQDVACRVLLLAAPRDGLQPVAGSSWRVTGYSATGTTVHDSGALPLLPGPRGLWVYILPAVVTARRWRIAFSWGAGQPYAQFGRLYIGPALITGSAIGYGLQRGAGDLGSSVRSAGSGVRYATRGATVRQLSWALPSLSAADAATLAEIGLEAGSTGQVFVAPSILTPERDGVLGVFRTPPAPRQANFIFWSADISIEEDR